MEQEIFQRTQFTFYESFYNSIEKTLRKKSEKLIAYEALIQYALYGTITEKENIPPAVSGLLEAFYPFLNTARRKAKNAKQSSEAKRIAAEERCKDKNEQKTEIKSEIEIKSETKTEIKPKSEIKSEIKTDKEIEGSAADFERFWLAYPKKVGKEDAYKAFVQAGQPVGVLLKAIEQQKFSPQWMKNGGAYIPSPARWLMGKRWLDQIAPAPQPSFGNYELDAIRHIMANPTPPI